MLPVSGALQLKISEDQPTPPMISHSGAYSRFVGPRTTIGMRQEHDSTSPRHFAFGFNSSTSGIGSQRALPSRFDKEFIDRSLVRIDVFVEEGLKLGDQRLDLVAVFELHGGTPEMLFAGF